jgi:uncharacterized protein YbjT (DUF2867 family)
MILVVGATGMLGLGGEICRRLVARGERVRALVRTTSDADRVRALQALGIAAVVGDLRDPASLDRACSGAEAVITTASAVPFSYVAGENDIESVDLHGTSDLVEAARTAGVGHFVYVSFSGNLHMECPLTDAKRAVERTLRASGMRYSILRVSAIMEAWLGPMVGFDYANARATIYGRGVKPISYVALGDVAEFAVRSLTAPAAWSTTLELGGPEPATPLDAVRIFERVSGRTFQVEHVPDEALEALQAAATDPMALSSAVLMRNLASGDAISMGNLLAAIPVELMSVSAYAERVLSAVPAHA